MEHSGWPIRMPPGSFMFLKKVINGNFHSFELQFEVWCFRVRKPVVRMMNQIDWNSLCTKFELRYSQSVLFAVKFAIYFFYDMNLVDLIFFTVGDPQGC